MRCLSSGRALLTIALGVCGIAMTFSAAAETRGDAAVPVPDAAIEPCEHLSIDQQAACLEERDRRDAERDAAREAAWHALGKGYLRPLAERLAASGDPRKLAIAAKLWSSTTDVPGDRKAGRWRTQAFDKGGDDPVVAILLQNDTRSVDGFARRTQERWRASEPGNLVPAMRSGEPVEALLARADTFDRFSLHLPDLLSTIDAALATFPPDEAQRALLRDAELDIPSMSAEYALSWGVVVSPAFMPLVNACKGDARHATPTRNLECRQLGRVMLTHSDSVLGELFGAALLRHDDDAALRAEGDAWRRRWAWQSKRLQELGEHAEGDCTPAKMRATPGMGEGDAIRACLTDAGVPLAPPADWDPDAPTAPSQ